MALGLALLLNALLLVVVGLIFLKGVWWVPFDEPVAVQQEAVATVYLEPVVSEEELATPEREKEQFTRTSPDQAAEPERETNRIGERSTRATSDRSADPTAGLLPSQAGVEPRDDQDLETTESSYQDGQLDPPSETSPVAPLAEVAPPEPVVEKADPVRERSKTLVQGDGNSLPPPREKLLEGPEPFDVEVPREVVHEDPPDREAREVEVAKPADPKPPVAEQPKPAKPDGKSFQGFQRKTAIVGSISRTGRSALDVDDSELGRYHAKLSRAVEQEWQRNCVRHRDFITPGFLTVRFFVEPSGKVRSVQFVGDMETGEVQKGFTLNSIRDAEIPPMPEGLKSSYQDEPLELIFRFYF